MGSGRVDLHAAALAGLVMDETYSDFIDANPDLGGDVKTLNLPALRNVDCKPQCSWQRTVRNTLGVPSEWSASASSQSPDVVLEVSPASFAFTGDTTETVTLTITAIPQGDLGGSIVFGDVTLVENAAQAPEAHLSVAVSGSTQLFADGFEP